MSTLRAGRFAIGVGIARIAVHLVAGLLISACVFPFVDAAKRRRHVQRWSAKLLTICGISVEVAPAAAQFPVHALVVANHVSWLDIFVINTLQPCRFVAKADIRDWPLLGWLSAKAGTIFIARGKLRAVRRIFEYVVETIRDGDVVAFFPEGTTAAQGALLPFHSNLFEAAIDAAVPIQPVALRYLDSAGVLAPQANFIGETTFVESLLTILRSEKLVAQLIVLPVIDTAGTHRRELAAHAQAAINTALGYSAMQPATVSATHLATHSAIHLVTHPAKSPESEIPDNSPETTHGQ